MPPTLWSGGGEGTLACGWGVGGVPISTNLSNQKVTENFLEVSGTVFPGERQYGSVISLWNAQGLTNRSKVFLFKFFNNILGINTRLSHFVPNHPRGCTFCVLNGTLSVPDETFMHIFFECGTVRSWHDGFLADYFPNNYVRNEQDRRNIFFLGRVHEPDSDNFFISISILLFQYLVWEQKLRKKTSSFHTLMWEDLSCKRLFPDSFP